MFINMGREVDIDSHPDRLGPLLDYWRRVQKGSEKNTEGTAALHEFLFVIVMFIQQWVVYF